ADQVDGAELVLGLLDAVHDVGLARDIGRERQRSAAELVRDRLHSVTVAIHDDDTARAFGGEAPAQRPSDAIASTRDDCDLVGQLHPYAPIRRLLRRSWPR